MADEHTVRLRDHLDPQGDFARLPVPGEFIGVRSLAINVIVVEALGDQALATVELDDSVDGIHWSVVPIYARTSWIEMLGPTSPTTLRTSAALLPRLSLRVRPQPPLDPDEPADWTVSMHIVRQHWGAG